MQCLGDVAQIVEVLYAFLQHWEHKDPEGNALLAASVGGPGPRRAEALQQGARPAQSPHLLQRLQVDAISSACCYKFNCCSLTIHCVSPFLCLV